MAVRAIVLGVVLLAGACMTPYERSSTLYDNGRYEAAQTELEAALEERPEDPRLNLMMARVLIGQEKYREARGYAQTAREAPTTRAEGATLLGEVYRQIGQPELAAEQWREARRLDSGSVDDARYKKVLVAAIGAADSEKKFEKALAFRKQLEKLDGDHPKVASDEMRRVREEVAEAMVRRGEYEAAAKLYRTLGETYGGDGTYAYERGTLLLKLARPDEAEEAFDRYVERGKGTDRTDRLVRVAETATSNDAPEIARRFYRRAVESIDDGPSFRRARLRLKLAALQFEGDSFDKARSQLQAYLEDMRQLQGRPLKPEVYIEAANTATEANQARFAAHILEKAIEAGTSSWTITSRLAEHYAVQTRPSRVEEVLKQYIDRSDARADALQNAAQWARNRQNYDLAQHYYQQLVAEAPDRPGIWLELARVHAQLGRIDKLRSTLQTFVRKHEGDRQKLFEASSLYEEHKLYGEAEEVLLQIQDDAPENLVVADRLAELYRTWNKPERIHEAYRTWIEARGKEASDFQLVGERLLRRDKRRQALPYFEKAAERGVVEAWLQIADIYKQQRREVEMKKALDRYVEAADNRAEALRNALSRYQSTSMTDEKISILEELIELESDLLSHYKRLGLAYLEQGRVDAAFDLWRRYVERADTRIEALRTIGSWFEQSGRADLVLSFYQRWLDDDPDPRLYRLVGDAYLNAQTPRARFQRGGVSPPASEGARKRARDYYQRYLDEAEPSYHQLRKFAVSMRHMRMWEIAARAYQKLRRSSGSGSVVSLHLGESLLHLGRTEKAVRILRRYYRTQGETPEHAEKVADLMTQFQLYDRAEPFLRRMFESNDGDTLQAAFLKLSDVYLKTGRKGEISSLVTDYLGRASNPTKARKIAVRILTKRGLYDDAATQIERIREFQGDVMGYKWGKNLFRAGRFEEAKKAFRTYASNNPYTAAVWLKIADFYEAHGRPEQARWAYDRAIKSAPDDFKPYSRRGRFRLLSGQLEAGRKDFREALDRASDKQDATIRKTQIEALRRIGHFGEATELARRALETLSQHRTFFLEKLAQGRLPLAEEGRARRLIDRLRGSSMQLVDVVDLLVEHGHRSRAAEMIERELETGNHSPASEAILQNPTIFTRLRGLKGLKSVVDPLLDKRRDDSSELRTRLGEFFIRQGDYDNGVLYLRSAQREGRHFFGPILAQTYLLLDRPRRARELFQRDLARVSGDRRRMLIRQVGMRYELLGRGDVFRDLLHLWSLDGRWTAPATRLLLHGLVSEGRTEEALGRLQRLAARGPSKDTSDAARPGGDAARGSSTLAAALEALAAEGYEKEALATLRDLPDAMREHVDLREFRFHLAALRNADGLSKDVQSLIESAASPAEKHEKRLELAKVLMVNGHYDLARETARPGMKAADPETIGQSAEFLMRNARAAGREGRIDEIASTYRSRVSDELGADTTIGQTMMSLALDERGVEHLVRAAERAPTQTRVASTLASIRAAGDPERMEVFVERLMRIGETPLEQLRRRVGESVDRQESKLSMALLKPHRETYPADLQGRLLEARIAFRSGDVEAGRDVLRSYLESVDRDPLAVERVLRFLDERSLHVEALNLVDRPMREAREQVMTADGLARLGYAHVEMERRERGRRLLERAVEESNTPAERAVEIARSLDARGHHELAVTFGDRAVSRSPNRPDARLSRGLARLAMGDIESGRSDLEQGLNAGINRLRTLAEAGKAALEADRPRVAEQYLLELARTPNSLEFGTLLPLRLAVSSYIDSGHAEEGVEFLANHFPQLAGGQGIVADEILPQLSTLHEKAGMMERAFEIYRQGIRREQLQNPDGTTIPVYLNNLAYTYSTTNRHVDRGFELVRRAIAASDSRQASYIDTLGWLQYRKGDLKAAEAHIRSSLRSSNGTGPQLMELYDHLVEVRGARGDHEDAFWLQNAARSLKRR